MNPQSSTSPRVSTGQSMPPRTAPGLVQEPDQEEGLYGPRGWTVRAGVWHALADCRDDLRSTVIPAQFGFAPAGIITAEGTPQDDYTPFHDLGPATARRLLEVLPAEQLRDRQNLGPSLGALLRACVRANGRVRLSGYGIGPQRPDERVSVEGLWIEDPDLLEALINAIVGEDEGYRGCCGCQDHAVYEVYEDGADYEDCEDLEAEELAALMDGLQRVWSRVAERYDLDANAGPDEFKPLRRHWTHGALGAWLWWD
ncbi:hypothetical protein [Actinomyces qiguomingii]|uniref:hypothetical protein n=1 Tax=Actinomyces qiguomingii TaxID=2057800 RepID=UPI001E5CAE66|nr:hypothetical protein [Actinomyces qiguomingii]